MNLPHNTPANVGNNRYFASGLRCFDNWIREFGCQVDSFGFGADLVFLTKREVKQYLALSVACSASSTGTTNMNVDAFDGVAAGCLNRHHQRVIARAAGKLCVGRVGRVGCINGDDVGGVRRTLIIPEFTHEILRWIRMERQRIAPGWQTLELIGSVVNEP